MSVVETLQRAETLIELGRSEQAVELLGKALASEPNDAKLWCQLARAQLGLGRNQEVLEAAGQAIALAPDDEYGHRLASYALSEFGKHRQAAQAARECVRLAPDRWATHARLAETLAFTVRGRWGHARRAAERAVALAPDEPNAHLALAMVAFQSGRRRQARKILQQVLRLQPDNHFALHHLARLAWDSGKFGSAVTGFGDALSVKINQETIGQLARLRARLLFFRAFPLIVCGVSTMAILGAVAWQSAHPGAARDLVSPVVAMSIGGVVSALVVKAVVWGRLHRDIRRQLRGLPRTARGRHG